MNRFPDQEAAIGQARKTRDEGGKYTKQIYDAVVAALGDEPLYRSEPDAMMYTKGKFIQVWPKEAP